MASSLKRRRAKHRLYIANAVDVGISPAGSVKGIVVSNGVENDLPSMCIQGGMRKNSLNKTKKTSASLKMAMSTWPCINTIRASCL